MVGFSFTPSSMYITFANFVLELPAVISYESRPYAEVADNMLDEDCGY